MNALISLMNPIIQWLIPLMLIRHYDLSYVGQYSLFLSFASSIVIVLMLSSKNFSLAGYFSSRENQSAYQVHKSIRFSLLVVLLFAYLLCLLFAWDIFKIIFFVKFVDVYLDSMVSFSKQERYQKYQLFALIIAVLMVCLSINHPLVAFDYFVGIFMFLFLLMFYLNHRPAAYVSLPVIKSALNSVSYQFSSTFLMFFQRYFIAAVSSMEALGFYSLLLQFVVFWSIFIQAAFAQFNTKIFSATVFKIFFVLAALLAIPSIYLVFQYIYLILPPSGSDFLLLLVIFACVFIELSFYIGGLKENKIKFYLPNLVVLCMLVMVTGLSVHLSQSYAPLVVVCLSYILRCGIFYWMSKRTLIS
ncbi:hypothetical protein ACRRS0_09455 [Agarivorans sp. QJM3NY_29]|uniref:hypothetical protein n=1 Tax=unclassified Agarivorans TaxID=2636026 RepID=UPI003D7CE604